MKNEKEELRLAFQMKPLQALALISGLCLLLHFPRVLLTNSLTHVHLIWNLFLAWVPLGFAYYLYKYFQRKEGNYSRLKLTLLVFFWLLFFPNAPYLISDLIHLKINDRAIPWFDAVLIFNYAFAGLSLALASLFLIHVTTFAIVGRVKSWAIIVFSTLLSGYGIFLGRIIRFNSWDLFIKPAEVLEVSILYANNNKALYMTITYTFLILAFYIILFSLISYVRSLNGHHQVYQQGKALNRS